MINFGIKLKNLRLSKEMTQEKLASAVGVTPASISSYESSSMYPSVETLINLAQFFHVSIDYLVGLKDEHLLVPSGLTDDQIMLVSELIRQFTFLNHQAS